MTCEVATLKRIADLEKTATELRELVDELRDNFNNHNHYKGSEYNHYTDRVSYGYRGRTGPK